MKQWIAKWLSQPLNEPNWVHEIKRDGLMVRVCEYDKACGHEGYAVELAGLNHEEERLIGLGFVGAEDLQRSIMLLQEALAFVNEKVTTPRELQTVWLRGATYYVDERLGELRMKDDPSQRFQLVAR
jgi:hypothetical protein